MGLSVTAVVLAVVVLFLVDVTLYTVYTVRRPHLLALLYGRIRHRKRGLRTVPGKLYRSIRGAVVEVLIGSPAHLELSERQLVDADLREEYSGQDVTQPYDV